MKQILVPIDFSKTSKFAVKAAAAIAKKNNSEIHLLHLVELPSGVIDMGSGSNFSIPESMLYLRKVKENILSLKKEFFTKKTIVHYSIRFEDPHLGILNYAEKINADIIVMGSKGQSDFEEIFIGSNTEKVVRTSPIPVLVIKKDSEDLEFKNIVFASKFKKELQKEVLKKVMVFAELFKAKIHLVNVNTPSNFETTYDAYQKINLFIDGLSISKYTLNIYNDYSIEKGILNFSKDINADLIALSTHGRSGLSHLFSASVTKSLSKNALKPLLTFKI